MTCEERTIGDRSGIKQGCNRGCSPVCVFLLGVLVCVLTGFLLDTCVVIVSSAHDAQLMRSNCSFRVF